MEILNIIQAEEKKCEIAAKAAQKEAEEKYRMGKPAYETPPNHMCANCPVNFECWRYLTEPLSRREYCCIGSSDRHSSDFNEQLRIPEDPGLWRRRLVTFHKEHRQ